MEPEPPPLLAENSPYPEKTIDSINAMLSYRQSCHTQQEQWIKSFKESMPHLPFFLVPNKEESIHDVATLSRLAPFLVD